MTDNVVASDQEDMRMKVRRGRQFMVTRLGRAWQSAGRAALPVMAVLAAVVGGLGSGGGTNGLP